MRIAIISPLEKRGSAISKYSYTLFKALREHVQISLFHDSPNVFHYVKGDKQVKRISIKDLRGGLKDYDIVHFQLGNSTFHHFQNHLLYFSKKLSAKIIATVHDPTLRCSFDFRCISCWGLIMVPNALTIIKNASYFLSRGPLDFIRPTKLYIFPHKAMDFIWLNQMDGLIFHSKYLEKYIKSKISLNCLTRVIKHIGYFHESKGDKTEEQGVPTIFVPAISLEPVRAIDIVIEALSKISFKFKVVISGEGTHKKDLINMVKNYELTDKINFVGFLDEEEFMQQLTESDIVLVPRRFSEGEVSGGMIHALCEGKPLIGPNIGAFPEYLGSGNGFLCDPISVNSWKENIERLIGDNQLRATLGNKAITFAKEELLPRKIAKEHIEFYEEVSR